MFDSIKELVETATKSGKPLSELIIDAEVKSSGVSMKKYGKK